MASGSMPLLVFAFSLAGGCLSPPDRAGVDGGKSGDDAGAPFACSDAIAETADLVYFSFEPPAPLLNLATDVQGTSEDLTLGGGRHGDGLAVGGEVIKSVDLGDVLAFGPPLTVEAWVRLNTSDLCQTIVSDWPPDAELGNLAFEVSGSDGTRLWAGKGGDWAESDVALSFETWHHAAATWDGDIARFYLDVELSGEKVLNDGGVHDPLPVRIGARQDDTCPMRGRLDEVKVSSCVKSQAQLSASAAFDPLAN